MNEEPSNHRFHDIFKLGEITLCGVNYPIRRINDLLRSVAALAMAAFRNGNHRMKSCRENAPKMHEDGLLSS